MPNIISSAIVNTPPPDALADLLNKRNKVHHLDADTDEDMIPLFTHDVNDKPRNNKTLLNRRNWCSIRLYDPEMTPPQTPITDGSITPPLQKPSLLRRLSGSRGPRYAPDAAAPSPRAGFFGRRPSTESRPPVSNQNFLDHQESISTFRRGSTDSHAKTPNPNIKKKRTISLTRNDFIPNLFRRSSSRRRPDDGGINGYGAESDDYDDDDDEDAHYESHAHSRSGIRGGSGGHDDDEEGRGYFPSMPLPTGRAETLNHAHPIEHASTSIAGAAPQEGIPPRMKFHRMPTNLSQKQIKRGLGEVNLEGGLDICLNMEISPKDPAGITVPYRLLVPALWYDEEDVVAEEEKIEGGEGSGEAKGGLMRWASGRKREKVSPERGAEVTWKRIG